MPPLLYNNHHNNDEAYFFGLVEDFDCKVACARADFNYNVGGLNFGLKTAD